MSQENTQNHWEGEVIQKVLLEHINEQRRARRWGIFFKLLVIAFVIILFASFSSKKDAPPPVTIARHHTALIDVYGEIDANEQANADDIRQALRSAFENKLVKGVVIRINSPGGSAVQARQVYDEIKVLRQKHQNTKIYAAIEDVGTSAAYLIACATDEIYSDKTSFVGSIGAKIDSFGFVEAMQKIGVERRIYSSGQFKNILDPYSQSSPEETAFVISQVESAHRAFIENVIEGRGNRIDPNDTSLFSGLFWSGDNALKLGLIDGFGDTYFIARELLKTENIVDYTPRISFFDKIARRVGASIAFTFTKLMR